MSAPTFTYTAQLNTNVSTPNVVITDTTNYSTFVVADMLAIIQESSNSVVFYQNAGWTTPSWSSPDLNGATSTLSFQYNLPLDSNGNVPLGTYTFVIWPYYNGVAQSPVTVTVNYQFMLPVPTLNIGYSLSAGQLNAADNTDYSNVIGATLQSATRTMTLIYPQGSGQSNIVTPNPLITIGANTQFQFWTGDYQLTVSTICVYQVGLNTVTVTIKGYTSSGNISAEANLCNLRGCIYGVFQKWIGYIGNNAAQAEFYGNLWAQCDGYWADIIMSRECGNEAQIQNDIIAIQTLLNNSGCGCGCPEPSSDVPIQIFPMNTVPLNTVVAAGTDIAVSTNTVGNTTTYTVSLSSGFLATITTIEGDITSINASIATLTSEIAALVSSKYLKLYEVDTDVSSASSGNNTLGTYTVAANSLATNGSELVIYGYFYNSLADSSTLQISAVCNANDMINLPLIVGGYNDCEMIMTIARIDDTHYRTEYKIKYLNFYSNALEFVFSSNELTSIDFAADTIVVSWIAAPTTAPYTNITLQKSKVELYNK